MTADSADEARDTASCKQGKVFRFSLGEQAGDEGLQAPRLTLLGYINKEDIYLVFSTTLESRGSSYPILLHGCLLEAVYIFPFTYIIFLLEK